ncbi:hypothetical protein [Desulfobacterium sp. N47]|uniref:Core-binding (CB) domain-containing protein n=1 Tax=uncultured Desulfobacterium sp. TaxID=201089 RepID=E1YLI7_9BACT|nr:hypothetical protein N47_E44820 [uncultured Desulfobacterium sp.]
MLPVPFQILEQFEIYFKNQITPKNLQWAYKKWLRYYLDFCGKYNLPSAYKDSLPEFIKKLHEKKQSKEQQDQATIAVKLYYEIIKAKEPTDKKIVTQSISTPKYFTSNDDKALSVRESAAMPVCT